MRKSLPKRKIRLRGQILLSILISIGIFAILAHALFTLIASSFDLVNFNRSRITARHLAQERIELIRNMPYADIGTVGGIPDGTIEDEENIVRNGLNFIIKTLIENESIWRKDWKGINTQKIIIKPMLNYTDELITKYIKHYSRRNFVEKANMKEYEKIMEKISCLGQIQKLISTKSLERKILTYIAPFLKINNILSKDDNKENNIKEDSEDINENIDDSDSSSFDKGWDDYDKMKLGNNILLEESESLDTLSDNTREDNKDELELDPNIIKQIKDNWHLLGDDIHKILSKINK